MFSVNGYGGRFFPKRLQSGCIKVNRVTRVHGWVGRCGSMHGGGGKATRPDPPAAGSEPEIGGPAPGHVPPGRI